jgi:ribokinase
VWRAGGAVDAQELEVIGLGALNVDLIAPRSNRDAGSVDDNETVATMQEILDRCAAEGLTPAMFLGGSAFNAIVMLAQLRTDLRLGMVGISAGAAYGVAESHGGRLGVLGIADLTRRSEHRPGLCLALLEEHRRRLYTSPEANVEIADYLREDDRPRESAARARVLHVTSLLEDPQVPGSNDVVKAVAGFVEAAKADNPALVLSFDPGSTWVDGLGRLPDLRRIYALADVLYVNPMEYGVLSGSPYPGGGRAASLLGLCPAGTQVVVKPIHQIVVHRADGFELSRVPRVDDDEAVDPTGAGDAVAAGVLAALGEGRSVTEGCRLGLRIAAQRVSDLGDRGHVDLRRALGELWPPGTSSVIG